MLHNKKLNRILHLDIYRGLAIILVVLYHFQLDLFKFGFLGVDIFFVISGFLMHRYFENNSSIQKLYEFYSNRISRIFPLYFFSIFIISLIYIFIISHPIEFYQYFEQIVFSIFLIPNIYFWTNESYFGSRFFSPMLHFWSLGVEIQFYLLCPIIFYFLKKYINIFYLILILSLILFFGLNIISPKTSFFMMPTRFWEFGIGIFSSMIFHKKKVIKETNLGILFFLIIIFFIIFLAAHINFYQTQEENYVFLSVIISLLTSAGLILGFPKKILISFFYKLFLIFSLYSFSIYVWHYPIIKIFHYATLKNNSEVSITFLLILSIILASITSYHLIEKYFRYSIKVKPFLIFYFIIVSISLFLYINKNFFFKKILTEKKYNYSFAFLDRETYRCGKFFNLIGISKNNCLINQFNDNINKALLYGDSQSDSLKFQLKRTFDQFKISLYQYKYNKKLLNEEDLENLINNLLKNKIKILILHSYPGNINLKILEKFLKDDRTQEIFLIMVSSTPVYNFHIPLLIYYSENQIKNFPIHELIYNNVINFNISKTVTIKDEINFLKNLNYNNFYFINSIDIFCKSKFALIKDKNTYCSYMDSSYRPYYFDNHHLTNTGSTLFEESFQNALNKYLKF